MDAHAHKMTWNGRTE